MDARPGQPRLPFAPFLEVRGLHPELSVSSLFTALQGRGGRQGLHTGFGAVGAGFRPRPGDPCTDPVGAAHVSLPLLLEP